MKKYLLCFDYSRFLTKTNLNIKYNSKLRKSAFVCVFRTSIIFVTFLVNLNYVFCQDKWKKLKLEKHNIKLEIPSDYILKNNVGDIDSRICNCQYTIIQLNETNTDVIIYSLNKDSLSNQKYQMILEYVFMPSDIVSSFQGKYLNFRIIISEFETHPEAENPYSDFIAVQYATANSENSIIIYFVYHSDFSNKTEKIIERVINSVKFM